MMLSELYIWTAPCEETLFRMVLPTMMFPLESQMKMAAAESPNLDVLFSIVFPITELGIAVLD